MTGKQEVWDDVWKSYEIDINDYSKRLFKILKSAKMEPVKNYVTSKETGTVKIVECGCGSGKLTLSMAKVFGTEAHLFDISKEAVKMAMKNSNGLDTKSNIFLASITDTPYKNDAFDITMSFGVNEHFEGNDRQKILDEMIRITKMDGMIIVLVPNKMCFPYVFGMGVRKILGKWRFGLEIPYSKNEIKRLAKKTGVKIEHMESNRFLSSFVWLMVRRIGIFNFLFHKFKRMPFPLLDNIFGQLIIVILRKQIN